MAPAPLPMGTLGTGPHATGQKGGQIDVFWGGTGRGRVFAAGRTDGMIDVFWQKVGSSHR